MSKLSGNSAGKPVSELLENVPIDTSLGGNSQNPTTAGNSAVVEGDSLAYDAKATASAFAEEFASHDVGDSSLVDAKEENHHVAGGLSDVINRFGRNDVSADEPAKFSGSSDRTPTRFPGLSRGAKGESTSKAVGNEGIYGKLPKTAFPVRRGKVALDADTSLFPFNYVAGRASDYTISVSRDDRMSPSEARARLARIFSMFGIENEPHEYLFSFTHAVLVAHALNGASIVGPGRASFSVGADSYSYGDVVKTLGQDMRRFFRAYADETAKALAIVIGSYDPSDSNSVMICGQIRMIAVAKRLIQFPYLIHDSADACVRINTTEAAAVLNSKNFVLDKKPNAVESLGKTMDGN